MTKLLKERVAFYLSDRDREALRLISKFEDSESALLRRLIKEEAIKQNVWIQSQVNLYLEPNPLESD